MKESLKSNADNLDLTIQGFRSKINESKK